MFVYSGKAKNGRGVWQEVDEYPDFLPYYVYYSPKNLFWVLDKDLDDSEVIALISDGTYDKIVPEGGASVYKYNIPLLGIDAYVMEAHPHTDAFCFPLTGEFVGVSKSEVLPKAFGFHDCARNVALVMPDATAVSFSTVTKQCFAILGDTRFGHLIPKHDYVSCRRDAPAPLPGKAKSPFKDATEIAVDGGAVSFDHCVQRVRNDYPRANGATFGLFDSSCVAAMTMTGVDATTSDIRKKYRSGFINESIPPVMQANGMVSGTKTLLSRTETKFPGEA
mmetsp:Transcript_1471/g.1701  ORF Transcript_1471/g.1701 Transcript_1471/m.1701 type:complete len:278 (-) Transcript_1471:187-1020(-)